MTDISDPGRILLKLYCVMEIIVTHVSADFDAFAGMVAANKLYPGAKIILPTAINSNVRKFISLYEDGLPRLYESRGY